MVEVSCYLAITFLVSSREIEPEQQIMNNNVPRRSNVSVYSLKGRDVAKRNPDQIDVKLLQ